jgi:membrane carboxypeptidase/penicillin-binding protein
LIQVLLAGAGFLLVRRRPAEWWFWAAVLAVSVFGISTAALPVWLDYTRAALDGREQPEFAAPEGIVEVKIDPETGKPVSAEAPGVLEPFKLGTEPVLPADGEEKVEVKDLFSQ